MIPDVPDGVDDACLPDALRGPETTITRVGAGLSGAGVYRVEAAGGTYVLKIAVATEPPAVWRRRVGILRHAADAGLAPPVIHVDGARRAVVSAFVVDRSFPALLGTPSSRDAALDLLGRTLRRVHELPLPPDAETKDARDVLAMVRPALTSAPAFAVDAIDRIIAAAPPPRDRAPVLSHNDVNPTNLVYDGERLMLLDWDTAGANDPLYDLAAIAVFLRIDDDGCRRLIAAHDDAALAAELPARFHYSRRLVAVMCGAIFLGLARQAGHRGDAGADAAPASLGELYQQLGAGAVSIATADGKWRFGLALIGEGIALEQR